MNRDISDALQLGGTIGVFVGAILYIAGSFSPCAQARTWAGVIVSGEPARSKNGHRRRA